MAHEIIQNSSFITKLLQHSHYHLSGDCEVISWILISPKLLKRRARYKASFMQIQPVFWLFFSFYISPLAELSQSSRSPAVLIWVVGRPSVVRACLHLPMCSWYSFNAVTQDSSSLPSDSDFHDFPFGCEETPALCWLFRSHPAYHPSYSLTCNIQALHVFLLHCWNQSTASVHSANTEFFACICFWCHFSLQRFFSCLIPASFC